jgi:fibronectin-binding autotransporter adhesin
MQIARVPESLLLRSSVAIMLLGTAAAALASPTYSYSGGAYSQNFDTLPSTTASVNTNNPVTIGGITYTLPTAANTPFSLTDTSLGSGGHAIGSGLDGWWSVGLSSNGDKLGAHYGDQSTGGLVSFGAPSGTNRAIGLIGTSSTGITEMGLVLVNNSGATLNQITLSYTGQLWRQNTSARTLNFGYYVDTAGTANLLSAASSATVDNNLKVSFASGSQNFSGSGPLSANSYSDSIPLAAAWEPGTSLWLTWQISSAASNGQGLALDNFSFSATNANAPSTDTWNASSGTWDAASPNWTGGNPSANLFKDGDTAVFGSIAASGTVTVAPAGVSPAAVTISNASSTYTFTGGAIGGNATLSKVNGGAVILAASNSYTGGTAISGGTLTAAAGDRSLGVSAGTVAISNGATLQVAGTGLASSRAVTVGAGGGVFDTGGLDSSIGGTVAVTGPFSVVGGGNLTLAGNITSNSTAAPLTIATGTTLTINGTPGNELQFLKSGGVFNGNLVISAPVRLDFNNGVYSGTGEVRLAYPGNIVGNGSDGTSSWILLANGGTSGTITSAGTLATDVHLNSAGLPHVRSDVTAANFSLATASPFIVGIGDNKPATNTFAITGNIYGDADVVLGANDTAGGGNGRLLLAGSNSYTGATLIAGKGIIALGNTAALPQATDVIFNFPFSGSTNPVVDLNGFSQRINSLSSLPGGPGTAFAISNSGVASPATLTVCGDTTPAYPFAGQINDGLSTVALCKLGSGTLGLAGASNYSGGTTVGGGVLQVSNSGATGVGPVAVLANAVLASSTDATIDGPVDVAAGGLLLPGGDGAVGTLTLARDLALDAHAVLKFDILGDQLDTLLIGGSLLGSGPIDLDISASGGLSGDYVLATFGLGTNLSAADFHAVGIPAGYALEITANQLDLTPVPEPGTLALAAAAALAVVFRPRRGGGNCAPSPTTTTAMQ